MELNKIYTGDCLEIMNEMEEKSIQLILTSPPYNASIRKDNHKYPGGNYNDALTDEQYIEWSVKIFEGYQRILKDKGVVAYNMSYTTFSPSLPTLVVAEIIKRTDFLLVDTVSWKKKNAVPLAGHPNRLTRICELVYIFVKKDHVEDFDCNKIVTAISKTGQKYFRPYYNFLESKNNDGSVDIHKATYSSDFAKYFIDLYSYKGSTVLDNFMGTGTTAVSCIDLDRNWIGIDLCEEYVIHANERISNHIKNPLSPHTPPKVDEIKDNSDGKVTKATKKKVTRIH